jgi:hypothetical protein
VRGNSTWSAAELEGHLVKYYNKSDHPLDGGNSYEGFAIVPTNGKADFAELCESISRSCEALFRLKSLAPNPRAQAKHQQTIYWLSSICSQWRVSRDQHKLFVAMERPSGARLF